MFYKTNPKNQILLNLNQNQNMNQQDIVGGPNNLTLYFL